MSTTPLSPLSLQDYRRKESGSGIKPFAIVNPDVYTSNWLLQHTFLVQYAAGEVLKKDGNVAKPLLYFATIEGPTIGSDDISGDSTEAELTEINFQLDMAPIRIRGTINKATTKLVADVGIVPTPNVFFKLCELNGNFSDNPDGISTGTFDDPFYEGIIVIRKYDAGNAQGKGRWAIVTGVDWVGFGLNVAGAKLPIII